jgi:hypothetical protein
MPFDTTKLRQPTVTVLPPTPPERGDGPRRIRIEIEIVDRRQQSPQRGYRFGTFTLWLIVLLLLAALAHGQQRYEHWQDITSGWHGQTRTEGSTTDWDAYGPDGQQKHCHRYYVGDQPYTTCR